jgi:hypothetical protein
MKACEHHHGKNMIKITYVVGIGEAAGVPTSRDIKKWSIKF